MREEILFQLKSLYRDDLRINGFRFGQGEKTVCIVGSLRGNEIQQLYTCGLLIQKLKELEEKGALVPKKKILVIPCLNSYSMNIGKRF